MLPALLIFLATLVLVIWQPRGLGIGWSAAAGAAVALLAGVIRVDDIPVVWHIVWNATGAFVAAPEHARPRRSALSGSRRSGRLRRLKRTDQALGRMVRRGMALLAMVLAQQGWAAGLAPDALPTGAALQAGSATVQSAGRAMTITQSSARAAIDWTSFNVGTGRAESFRDMITAMFAALKRPPNIEYIDMPESIRGQYQYFTQASTENLRRAGFDGQFTPLGQAVERYVSGYLDRADRFR